jgi:hypothetical protein
LFYQFQYNYKSDTSICQEEEEALSDWIVRSQPDIHCCGRERRNMVMKWNEAMEGLKTTSILRQIY